MSARVDAQVYRLAVSFLDGAPQAFIETLAYELQKVCAVEEMEAL